INYIGKLTYLITSDHRVSLSVFGAPTSGGGNGGVVLRNRSSSRAPLGPGLLVGGAFNSIYTRSKFDSLDIAGEVNSAFLDKRLPVEVRGGAHFQHDPYLPGAGSGLDDIENPSILGGVPRVSSPGSIGTPVYELDSSVPSSVRPACTQTGASCNVLGFQT